MQRQSSHFLILGCAALLLHGWVLTINLEFLSNAEDVSTTIDETSLLLQLQKVIPVISEPPVETVKTEESTEPIDRKVVKAKEPPLAQEEAREIDNKSTAIEETTSRQLVSQRRLNAFVADMVNEELKNPARIASFQSTFTNSIASSPSGTQIEEQENGNISVQTKMFGKAVCYDFAADGDPPLAFFKDCPKKDIKLDIHR
ncbi:MAG TPA: hypothetical protein DCW52_14475 [Gammaproteobacteria bacterium]|nr:hypothetical protein [Gammaproteobacteria bacterium]